MSLGQLVAGRGIYKSVGTNIGIPSLVLKLSEESFFSVGSFGDGLYASRNITFLFHLAVDNGCGRGAIVVIVFPEAFFLGRYLFLLFLAGEAFGFDHLINVSEVSAKSLSFVPKTLKNGARTLEIAFDRPLTSNSSVKTKMLAK